MGFDEIRAMECYRGCTEHLTLSGLNCCPRWRLASVWFFFDMTCGRKFCCVWYHLSDGACSFYIRLPISVLKLEQSSHCVPLPRDQLPPCLISPILVVDCISTSPFSSSIDCNKIPGLEGLYNHLLWIIMQLGSA